MFDAPVPFKGDVCPGVSPRVSFLLGPPGCSPRGQRPRLGPCAFLDLDSWQFKSLSFSGLLDGKGGQTLRLLESDEHRNCSFDQSSGSWLGRGQRTRLLEGLASHSMAVGGGKNSLKPPAHYPGPWAARLFHLSETYLSSKDQVKSPHFRAVLLDQPHQSGFSFLTARGAVGSVCITLGLLLSTRQTAHAHVCVRERVPPPPGIQPLLQLGRASSPPSPLSKNVSWLMDISTSWVHHTSSSDGRSFY